MRFSDAQSTHLVRLFSDYADSPIWFAIGPVSYDEARLSAELRNDIEAWDASFYALPRASDDRAVTKAHVQAGMDIGRRLATELGDFFEVEVDADADGVTRRRFRGHAEPTNHAAAEAFRARVDALDPGSGPRRTD